MKEVQVYIHIPFCEKKCKYCNFVSYCVNDNIITQYVDKLLDEIKFKLSKEILVTSIYFGGGTPSLIDAELIEKILNQIKSCASISYKCEISIECNPNSATKEKLSKYYSYGFNRISFGAQTFDDDLLKKIGRVHTSDQIREAIKNCNEVGFRNISLDLIIGLPGQTLEQVAYDVDTAGRLNIQHVSCYSLILEEDTPLFYEVENKSCVLPDEDDVVKMYDYVYKELPGYGFYMYEVSNFALQGFECRHNIGYWHFKEYIGFGVAAHSYFNNFRKYNLDSLEDYILLPFDKIETSEYVDINKSADEYIMLALRTKWGVNIRYFKEKFGKDLLLEKSKQIKNLVELNLINVGEERITVSDKGFHVLNKIILELV